MRTALDGTGWYPRLSHLFLVSISACSFGSSPSSRQAAQSLRRLCWKWINASAAFSWACRRPGRLYCGFSHRWSLPNPEYYTLRYADGPQLYITEQVRAGASRRGSLADGGGSFCVPGRGCLPGRLGHASPASSGGWKTEASPLEGPGHMEGF